MSASAPIMASSRWGGFVSSRLQVTVSAILVLVAAVAFRTGAMQSVSWTYPYFSGAANFQRPFDWRISPSEYREVKGLEASEYLAHRHQRRSDTVLNSSNNYGYVLVVAAARTMFPWWGEGEATIALQILCHTLIVILIQLALRSPFQKAGFLAAYGMNPFILHFVTFPFYYFWAVIPSAVLALFYLKRRISLPAVCAAVLVLYLAVLIRPSTIFVALLVFALIFYSGNRLAAVIAGLTFMAMTLLTSGHKEGKTSPVWHTAYVGLGAYSNTLGISLADESAFESYTRSTGTAVSTDPVSGTMAVPQSRDVYYSFVKKRYLALANAHPWLVIRNAVMGSVQSFGPGYVVGHPLLSILSMAIGTLVMGIAVRTGQYILVAGIAAYAVAFTPYFPPIPAYLFGAYLLTTLVLLTAIEKIARQARPFVRKTR